ncbi:hypothetical protein [Sporomusa aerivorans]|uniref:hypothetical protein n=1 Tax=Sporomusa aerivorans TaxID=204936 RepID=UPI00352A148D
MLLPYNPAPEESEDPRDPEQTILRVTMIDSSEREYKLPNADLDGFVTWLTRTSWYWYCGLCAEQNDRQQRVSGF